MFGVYFHLLFFFFFQLFFKFYYRLPIFSFILFFLFTYKSIKNNAVYVRQYAPAKECSTYIKYNNNYIYGRVYIIKRTVHTVFYVSKTRALYESVLRCSVYGSTAYIPTSLLVVLQMYIR